MRKNGFTLVELMIVIVIIGILAGVSMPKFQRAADKTKAAEAPQILNAIVGAQETYRLSKGQYVELKNDNTSADSANWKKLGLRFPEKRYFKYTVKADTVELPSGKNLADNPFYDEKSPEFEATAELIGSMVSAPIGDKITINNKGEKTASKGLNLLIPSFGAITK
jgi:prepilin-type N-terminal cleavage/methylation domain-containing protein